jgi:hypothetical protein
MSRFLSYTFPAGNTTDVCALQTVVNGNNFIKNGNLAVGGQVSFNNLYSRNISFTSNDDISAARFTINGIQNGVAITEPNIVGPNDGTVYSVQIYDSITSIVVSVANATNVSVGTGGLGFLPLIGINLWPEVVNYTLTLASLTTTGDPHVALWGSLENIANNGSTYLQTITNALIPLGSVINIQPMGANTPPLKYSNTEGTENNQTYGFLLAQIGANDALFDKAIKMNFIQT